MYLNVITVRVSGYYRVVYKGALMDRILQHMNHHHTPFDQFSLEKMIGDIFEGAFAGVIGFTDAFIFLEKMIQLTFRHSWNWDVFFTTFDKIGMVLYNTKHYYDFSVRIKR